MSFRAFKSKTWLVLCGVVFCFSALAVCQAHASSFSLNVPGQNYVGTAQTGLRYSCSGNDHCRLHRNIGAGWQHLTDLPRNSSGIYNATLVNGSNQYRLTTYSRVASNAGPSMVGDALFVTVGRVSVMGAVPFFNVPAESADGRVYVSWGAPIYSIHNELQYRPLNQTAWREAYTGGNREHTMQLEPGTYQFRVRACLDNICSPYSTSSNLRVLDQAAPTHPYLSNSSIPVVASPDSVPTYDVRETDLVGVTGGAFRVDESGAATYSIPIQLAPGTAGVTPPVAINYASQSGAGLLGQGWSVGGLSGISRCRQTLMQDRQALPISWGPSDRFCLDGQRLLVVSGTYGNPGSVYRTEVDSYVKVTAVGGSNGNPDYFRVEAKDGSITTYGETSHTRYGTLNAKTVGYSPAGARQSGRVLSWNISRFEDNMTNAIVYRYSQTANYHRLDTIEYAFDSAGRAGASVAFSYQNRPDPSRSYVSGSRFSNTVRISAIAAYGVDGSGAERLVRHYRMAYGYGNQPELLAKITECADGACLDPIEFEWGAVDSNGVSEFSRSLNADVEVIAQVLLDINGDGVQDLAWIEKQGGVHRVYYTILGSENPQAVLLGAWSASSRDRELRVLDYNLDGRDDLMLYTPGQGWSLYMASPEWQGGQVQWRLVGSTARLPFASLDVDMRFADFDSSGITDAYYISEKSRSIHVYRGRNNAAGNGYHFESTPIEYPLPSDGNNDSSVSSDLFALADINGNGRSDVVAVLTRRRCQSETLSFGCERVRSLVVYEAVGNSFRYLTKLYEGRDKTVDALHVLDINGDGLADIVYLAEGEWRLHLNRGGSFAPAEALYLGSRSPSGLGFADLNGDGHQDIYWQTRYDYEYRAAHWLPDEQRFSGHDLIGRSSANLVIADIAGNGAADRLYVRSSDSGSDSTGITLTLRSSSRRYLTGVKTALGTETKIQYATLSNIYNTEHYSTYGEISPVDIVRTICEERQPCRTEPDTVVNARDFYRLVHQPFSDLPEGSQILTPEPSNENRIPVQEVKGSIPVVTAVYSSAPTSDDPQAKVGVSYHYTLGLFQAAGRGMLGFKALTTRDLQTDIETVTTYRQDWPFIGQPIATVVRSEEQVLSESMNESKVLDFDSSWVDRIATHGSADLGPLRVYTATSIDLSYELEANSQSSGVPVQETTTTREIDEYGNVTRLNIEIHDNLRGQRYQTDTINEYGSETWQKELGRLSASEVITTRPDYTGGAQTRRVEYIYYGSGAHRGMLHSEIVVHHGKPDESIETRYFYDAFGNAVFTSTMGQDGSARLSPLKVYDSRGRFVDRVYGVFNGLLGAHAPGVPSAYTSELSRLGLAGQVSVQRISQVVNRDRYGTATETRQFTGPESNNAIYAATSPFGAVYMTYDSTGGYSIDTASRGNNPHCPTPLTAFHSLSRGVGGSESLVCFDLLGRPIRKADKSFDGTWIYTDTEYDIHGRTRRVSEPAFGEPSLWTQFNYDLLGRQTLALRPDGKRQETRYQATGRGLETTIVNSKGQSNTTVTNALGNMILSVDNDDGEIEYIYHVNGKLFLTIGRLTSEDATGTARTAMSYDSLGRKTLMHDGDKGQWQYRYNALGDLICQQDAEGNTIESRYDAAGRLIERLEKRTGDCSNLSGTLVGRAYWEYDTAEYGLGQISDEQDDFTEYRKLYDYDAYGRVATVRTVAPRTANGEVFHAHSVTYDQFGRVWKNVEHLVGTGFSNGNRELLRSSTQNVFNGYGYLEKVVDADDTRNEYYRTTHMDARGNVTGTSLGGSVITTQAAFHPVTGMLEQLRAVNGTSTRLQDLTMVWDSVGNLEHRLDKGVNPNATYRNLREEFVYDKMNRLATYTVTGLQPVSVQYNGKGNITHKSDVGDYQYERNNHAVTRAGATGYTYDNNGNVLSDTGGRVLHYTAYNAVERVTKSGRITEFHYAPDRSRFKRVDTNTNGRTTTTLYLGNLEYLTHENGTDEVRQYLGGAVLRTSIFNASGERTSVQTQYLLKDHLGSVNAIVNANGTLNQAMAFDPWGKRRNALTWQDLNADSWFVNRGPITNRGFTGHQMVDEMDIIHMNGRIYDPGIARFLQADPFVQAPFHSASLNRYSYVWNNPLNATDPSGYIMRDLKTTFRSAIGSTTNFIGSKTVTQMLGNAASLLCGYGAPACAAGWNYEFARAHGASPGQAQMSAMVSAGTAIMSMGIGQAYGNPQFLSSDHLTKVVLHGMVGGVASVAQGGNFGHGFVSAGAMEFAAPGISKTMPNSTGPFSPGFIVRTSMAATVGGTVSEWTGGKFRNGAALAAFQWMYNHEGGVAAQKEKNSELGVAKSTIQKVMKTSMEDNIEYGGLIYRLEDGTYGATINIGDELSVNVHAIAIPEGATAVASWHTHPGVDTFPNFSPHDISNFNQWPYPGAYLGSHDGNIYYYRSGALVSGPLQMVTPSRIFNATRIVGFSYEK